MAEKYTLTIVQQKLVEENLNFIDIILHTKIRPNESIRGMEYDELYQCGSLALCKAAAAYDGRVQFSTYASRVIFNAMIDQCRSAQKHYGSTLSSDAPISDGEDSFAELMEDRQTVDDSVMVKELKSMLSASKILHHGAVLKGIEAIELQLKGYSGVEIARMYGVRNNNATSWISKARAALIKEHPEFAK